MSNVDINGQARSQTQAHELSGSLTRCEDAQNKRRHPDRSRTEKIVSVSQTVLSPAKWLGLSHRQAKHPRVMLTTEGRVLEEILKTKFNLRSSTEEEDELKIAPRP